MRNQKLSDFIDKVLFGHYSEVDCLKLAVEQEELLRDLSDEELEYYIQSGAGDCLGMCVSGILMVKPELALQVPDLDIKRYQPIVR